jgi:SAM-dependent methyltransferase
MDPLDDPARAAEIRRTVAGKPALMRLYAEIYARFAACLARTPARGMALELGAGAGWGKRHVAGLVTSDVLPYPGVDLVLDATRLPFADASLRLICMLNVFHHIPDAAAFLGEAARCLVPGGRLLAVDQHLGPISTPILRWAHHEGFDPRAADWAFPSGGPLSSANGALAWIVFRRDRARLERDFPDLELVRYAPHTPLRYWLTGGLKRWCLLPGAAFGPATAVDRWLTALWPGLGSFVDVELVRRPGPGGQCGDGDDDGAGGADAAGPAGRA